MKWSWYGCVGKFTVARKGLSVHYPTFGSTVRPEKERGLRDSSGQAVHGVCGMRAQKHWLVAVRIEHHLLAASARERRDHHAVVRDPDLRHEPHA